MKRAAICVVTLIAVCLYSCKNKKETGANTINPSINYPIHPTEGPAIGLNLGNAAPEIILKNPEGIPIALSSLRGQIVLIDFWASWCPPCRAENPNLVKAYRLYKDKKFKAGNGFTIYSVSLDAHAGAWKKAIEKDSLAWASHVSDLKGWDNTAALKYGVTGIPVNFLVNGAGVIINRNLRGDALLPALEKLSQ